MLQVTLAFLVGLISLQAYASEPRTLRIDNFPCADIASPERSPSELSDKELFYASHAYDSGDCFEEEDATAYVYYRERVNRGGQFAMIRLGYFYANGSGVEQGLEKARYWFRSYALAYPDSFFDSWDGIVESLFYNEPLPDLFLAEVKASAAMYDGAPEVLMENFHALSTGNGVREDPERADIWLLKAESLGHPEAHYQRALIAAKNQDDDRSLFHLRIAAERNHPKAQLELGKRHLTGDGVILWPYKALVWFYIAQAGGLDVAQLIEETESNLDPLNIAQAKEAAAEFISDR